uniref:Uncharacterized protein n=1 Tax=Strombidium rassoulzadegani TaxID=1082188 RepID=A0A7S3FVB6_9SPIT|eukprot:CAMPEP_0168607522 /NCGR_PEP_ID=MMETSP0449_2-20121227/98_1 /TAXON_ID=1082188 /ORGANISM="Strombidium rassoulzadegani, Strain ras09" /LENGTH=143 /DNA_ID=CAMNT_0008647365 /DNA_START=662 /DNA_END=1093 /DNA_ORIENTATION=-
MGLLASQASANDVCCNACSGEGVIKTYSVDHIFNMCGESCVEESKYWLYKLFEIGMHKADNNTQNVCEGLGYGNYHETEVHGIPGIISIAVDLYKPDDKYRQEDGSYVIPDESKQLLIDRIESAQTLSDEKLLDLVDDEIAQC